MIDTKYISKLTNRELDVLRLLSEGYSNRQIAENLNIAIRTVKFHTANIYSKIEVNSRSAAIAWVWRNLTGPEYS